MRESSDGRFPVSEDHLRLERSSTLDQHPEYRSLQAFFEAGVRPPCSASTTFAGSVNYSCRFTPCF